MKKKFLKLCVLFSAFLSASFSRQSMEKEYSACRNNEVEIKDYDIELAGSTDFVDSRQYTTSNRCFCHISSIERFRLNIND